MEKALLKCIFCRNTRSICTCNPRLENNMILNSANEVLYLLFESKVYCKGVWIKEEMEMMISVVCT